MFSTRREGVMLLRNEAKVGSLIFVAVLVIIAMYWFLRGFGLGAATYQIHSIFADARKLDRGADVRMAGVKVGYVHDINLTPTSRARVDMTIWNDICIPKDSKARITTGGFIGDNYVEVIPGDRRTCLRAGQSLQSEEPMNYDKLIADVGGLVDQLKVSVGAINEILGDRRTIADIKGAINQLNLATGEAMELVRAARLMVVDASPNVQQTLANMSAATENAIKITADLDALVRSDVRPQTREVLRQARLALVNLTDATAEAKNIVTAVGGSAGHIETTLAKLESAAEQADEMLANLNQASQGIKDVTTDKELQQNIRATMQNAADATAEARLLLSNLNEKVGQIRIPGFLRGNGPGQPARPCAVPNEGFVIDSLWNTTEGEFRFDANYTFCGFGGGQDFYRLGAFNVGETTRANLQVGRMLTCTTALRGGIYASRVGIGADQWLGSRFLLSGDIFRPNDPQYDLRGILNLGSGWGLYGGVSNVLGGQDVFTGIHFTK